MEEHTVLQRCDGGTDATTVPSESGQKEGLRDWLCQETVHADLRTVRSRRRRRNGEDERTASTLALVCSSSALAVSPKTGVRLPRFRRSSVAWRPSMTGMFTSNRISRGASQQAERGRTHENQIELLSSTSIESFLSIRRKRALWVRKKEECGGKHAQDRRRSARS